MLNIQTNGTAMVKRGDSFNVPLFVNIGTDDNPVRLNFKDKDWLKVHFNIERAGKDGQVIFSKIFNSSDVNDYGDIMISITDEEINQFQSGIYEYSIEVTDDNDPDFNYTVTPNKMFYLF